MAKNKVCYKKMCWSIKNTILDKAGKIGENHYEEDLDIRMTPHSHDKKNQKNDAEKNEIKDDAGNYPIPINIRSKDNAYINADEKAKKEYEADDAYPILLPLPGEEKSSPDFEISHDHNLQEYEEFLIEQDPRGGLKVSNFYKTTAGEFRKKGLIPIYDVLRFNRY